ncbi:energy transducer TonB [Teichococcus vastitatis]|uniref:Energy transducer TonB n=1 Tax=Teichococcus vastitatis TaxID=2307076 RepID=A0ABS9W524_9PROT|nr:energy transducer TonB [Pseudoroseomonas vastitatis]MCI0753714.1 energy transducer TonB [Pseudoroseomonas vastitatis]
MPPRPRLLPELGRRLRAMGRPERPIWRRPGAWVSLALHAALLLALLRWTEPREMQPPGGPVEVPVVFETMQDTPPAGTPDAPEQPPAAPAPPGETPTELPDPENTEPLPPLPATPPVPPPPAVVAEAPPEPEPEPLPQAEPPPEAAAPPAAPPPAEAAPEAALPPPPEPAPEASPEATPAELPPVELAAPTPLQLNPQPPRPQRPEAPPRRAAPFPGTTDLSQAPPIALAPPSRRPPPGGGGGGVDLAIGPVPQRSQGPRPPAQPASPLEYVSGVRPDTDWYRTLAAWAQRRGHYPAQAAQAGEEGVTVMRVTVERSGRVASVRVISSSGSRWLDSASLAVFRDAVAPAFTPDMAAEGDSTTLNFRAYYHVIYR